MLRVRCILKSQFSVFSVTWSMLQSKPWSPVSVTTNPWPLVEKVSSWQICIKHYWISHPREQNLTKLRYCILCSTASAWKSWSRIPAMSKGCETSIWVMRKQGIRKPKKKNRCHIERRAIATSICAKLCIHQRYSCSHLHPARTVSIKGTPKTTQILSDATGQMYPNVQSKQMKISCIKDMAWYDMWCTSNKDIDLTVCYATLRIVLDPT